MQRLHSFRAGLCITAEDSWACACHGSCAGLVLVCISQCAISFVHAWTACFSLQVRKVGDYTSKLVAGMREDLDALSERVKNRNGGDDTEALLAVSQLLDRATCNA